MIVSRSNPADTSAPASIFSEGLSGFRNVEKKNGGVELSRWKLSGGISGVPALEFTFDTKENRIMNILAELSPDHPFVSQLTPHGPGIKSDVFVRIEYTYSNELSIEEPRLSDFINVKNDVITPAEKYKDYQIKFVK
jgi:hypothetical protein